MSIRFTVRGVNQMVNLAKMKGRQAQQATDRELERSSIRIERGAKNRAPVDTGQLKKTIFQGKAGSLTYKVVAPVHYAVYLEKGTRKMRAKPFLRPALEEERPRLLARLKQIYGK